MTLYPVFSDSVCFLHADFLSVNRSTLKRKKAVGRQNHIDRGPFPESIFISPKAVRCI